VGARAARAGGWLAHLNLIIADKSEEIERCKIQTVLAVNHNRRFRHADKLLRWCKKWDDTPLVQKVGRHARKLDVYSVRNVVKERVVEHG
jgi:hypothetical protein